MTPGMSTSEFALTILVVVSALILALTNHIEGDDALTAITGAVAAYGVSRGLAKRSNG